MTSFTMAGRSPDIQFHSFTYDDVQGMVDVFNTHIRSLDGQDVWQASDMEQHFRTRPNLDVSRDIIVVKDHDQYIGYGVINWHHTHDNERAYIFSIRVLAEYATGEIETRLLDTLIERVKEISHLNPTSSQELIQAPSIIHPNTKLPQTLENAGFERVRFSYKMIRDLTQPITLLPLPEGMEIRPALPEHYRAIWQADLEAFRDHWGSTQIEPTEENFQDWINAPDSMPALWKIAWEGDQVVGMVLNYVNEQLNTEYNIKRGYTEGICTRRPWRRQGVSAALLSESLQMFKAMGMTEAALGVDAHNPHGALGVYQRAGFKTVQELIWFRKPLIKE